MVNISRQATTLQLLVFSLVLTLSISPCYGLHGEERVLQNNKNSTKVKTLRDPRIINGKQVQNKDVHPYFARIRIKDNSIPIHCGGSLIGPDVILCAAHCDRDDLIVDVNAYSKNDRLDDASTITRSVKKRIKHPQYDSTSFAYDFLILILDEPVTTINPIKLNDNLALPNTGDSPEGGRDDLVAIGLGSDSGIYFQPSDYLQEVSLKTVSYDFCNGPYSYGGSIIEPVMFCAGFQEGNGDARDSCYGDSGGPLLQKETNIQLGVISWGVGCAMQSFPGVYANVAVAYSWIDDQACRESQSTSGGHLSCHQAQPVTLQARHRSRSRRRRRRGSGDAAQQSSGNVAQHQKILRSVPGYKRSGTTRQHISCSNSPRTQIQYSVTGGSETEDEDTRNVPCREVIKNQDVCTKEDLISLKPVWQVCASECSSLSNCPGSPSSHGGEDSSARHYNLRASNTN